MQEIADSIYEGAMAFLKREYQILSIFVLVVFGLLVWKVAVETGVAFLAGASCSVLAGYLGMQSATKANVRTSQAAMAEGEGAALLVAFNGGAVMGLAVASLGLLGVGIFLGLYSDPGTSRYISGFAMGASSIALFARVGGGIYTKAADVGSDLVGKLRPVFPRTTRATLVSLLTTWATTLVTWPAWVRIFSNPMSGRLSRPSRLAPQPTACH